MPRRTLIPWQDFCERPYDQSRAHGQQYRAKKEVGEQAEPAIPKHHRTRYAPAEHHAAGADENGDYLPKDELAQSNYRVQQVIALTGIGLAVISGVANYFMYQATNTSAEAARVSAVAAKQIVEDARKPVLIVLDVPEKPTIEFLPEAIRVAWTVQYENVGRGIAANLWHEFEWNITTDVGDYVFKPREAPMRTPEGALKTGATDTRTLTAKRLPEYQPYIDDFSRGAAWLNVQAIFHYADESGRDHGLSICRSYRSDGAITACNAAESNRNW